MKQLLIVLGVLIVVACGHDPEPAPLPKPSGSKVMIGTPAKADHTYKWVCSKSIAIDNPLIAQPTVKASCTGDCELIAETICGKASDKVIIYAFNKAGDEVKCP